MSEHHEKILKALSSVPLASLQQLAKLNQSLDPYKKASRVCKELEQDGLLEARYHPRTNIKLWKLTKTGKKLTKVQFKPVKNLTHALTIADLYFTIPHEQFAYEPQYPYKDTYLEPDAMIYGVKDKRKFLWCIEVQISRLSKKQWSAKWQKYGEFFNNEKYYSKASYQEWIGGDSARPSRFIVLTHYREEQVNVGFEVDGKKLEVKSEL